VFITSSGGDVSQLVHAAPPNADPTATPPGLTLRPTDEGFDGMFYYRCAVSPLSSAEWAHGLRLDLPALRTSRMLYPAIAGAVSLGNEALVPWTLLVVNVLAMGAVGYFGALIAAAHGAHPAQGLLFVAYPGFVYTLGGDLTELTEAAFVLAGLHLLGEQRFIAAAVALTGAVLAKETGLIVPLGWGLAWAWTWMRARRATPPISRPPLSAAVPAALPVAVFAGWQLALRQRFGVLPMSASSENNTRWPLTGFAEVSDRLIGTSGEDVFRALSLALVVGLAIVAGLAWRRSQIDPGVKLAWMAAVVLMLLISEHVYAGATSFMRAGTESGLLGVAMVLGARPHRHAFIGPAAVALTALTVVGEVVKGAT
jgi:hypothetical protein